MILQESLEKLFGTTLHLSASTIELTFPSAYERLHSTFFRTKVTSWMAAQEEDYRCTCYESRYIALLMGWCSIGPY